jgi:hypothetical protein
MLAMTIASFGLLIGSAPALLALTWIQAAAFGNVG